MSDIAAFPTLQQVFYSGNNRRTFIASGTILAGQVVCFASTGVSDTVLASVAGAGTKPIGVACEPATDGQKVLVAMDGCEVDVVIADGTTGVDAGDLVEPNDNAVGGTVNTYTLRAALGSTVIDGTNDTTIDSQSWTIGQALQDGTASSAGGTVRIIVRIQVQQPSDHAVV